MTLAAEPGAGVATLPEAEPWQLRQHRRSIKKKETLGAVLRLLPPVEGARCLELVCGNGAAGWFLRRRGGRWTSADWDLESVEAARELLGPEVRLLEADALPFPDASFDVVVAVHAIRHRQDDAGFAREVARVLEPGGRVVLTTPDGPSGRAGYRLKRLYGFTAERLGAHGDPRDGYPPAELVRLLAGAGLEVERVESYSRIFTEALELTLLYAYYRLAGRRAGMAEKHPGGTWSPGAGDLRAEGWKARAFAAVYPLLRGLSLLDRLIPFRPGYMYCARARKPEGGAVS